MLKTLNSAIYLQILCVSLGSRDLGGLSDHQLLVLPQSLTTFEEFYVRMEPSRYLPEFASSWLDDKVNSIPRGTCSTM